jgi:hypothetical protein
MNRLRTGPLSKMPRDCRNKTRWVLNALDLEKDRLREWIRLRSFAMYGPRSGLLLSLPRQFADAARSGPVCVDTRAHTFVGSYPGITEGVTP